MDKRTYAVGRFRAVRSDEKMRAKLKFIATQVGMFAAGLALTQGVMFEGARPMGLAFASASTNSKGGIAAMCGAFLGYALQGSDCLRYCASLIVCASCAAVFARTKAQTGSVFMPFCVFLSLLCTGAATLFLHFTPKDAILLLCEVTISASLTYFFALGLSNAKSGTRQEKLHLIGSLAILLAFFIAFQGVAIGGVISLSRVAAVFCVMAASYCGGSASGAACGVAFGAAFDLSRGMPPIFAGIYGFSGLFSGMSRGESRFSFAVCYVLANCLASLWAIGTGGTIAPLYECFIASVVFVVIPSKALVPFRSAFARTVEKEESPPDDRTVMRAQTQISQARAAVGELARSLGDFTHWNRKNDEDVSQVFHRAAERTCRTCPVSSACWDRDYVATFGAMNDVTQKLREHNKLETSDYPQYFSLRCINISSFAGAVNDEYGALLRRKSAAGTARETRLLMKKQCDGVDGVLRAVEASCAAPPSYPSLEMRAQKVAAAYFHRPACSLFVQSGRMNVDIYIKARDRAPMDLDAFTKSLSLALGRKFAQPVEVSAEKDIHLRAREGDAFCVEVGVAERAKDGEACSGDQHMSFTTEDGRAVIMLSDGMGSGISAAETSRDALEFIAGFARAGSGVCESALAVTPALSARMAERGFVTLDLLEINLLDGRCKIAKFGASPTYVVSGGKTRAFLSRALPAGLENGESEPAEEFDLAESSAIYMMSDGVADVVSAQFLQEIDTDGNSAAEAILERAIEAGEAPLDDMTAIVINVCRVCE